MENAAIPAHARIGTGHQVCPVYGRLLDGSGVGVSDGIGVVLGVTVGAALGVGIGVSLGVGLPYFGLPTAFHFSYFHFRI